MRVIPGTGEIVLDRHDAEAVDLFIQWSSQQVVSRDAFTIPEMSEFTRKWWNLPRHEG